MKRILLVFVLGILFSCTDSNDDGVADSNLQGEWVLTDVSCFCYFGEDNDFSTSKLLFSSTENKVTVIHEGNDNYFHTSGVFNYELNDDVLTIERETRSYTYSVEGDDLTLVYIDEPMIADDEVTYKYKRK